MAKGKKNKRLISKKTKKTLKKAAPWAVALTAVGGMVAAFADRSIRGKVSSLAAGAVEKVRPHAQHAKSELNGLGTMQESGAV